MHIIQALRFFNIHSDKGTIEGASFRLTTITDTINITRQFSIESKMACIDSRFTVIKGVSSTRERISKQKKIDVRVKLPATS